MGLRLRTKLEGNSEIQSLIFAPDQHTMYQKKLLTYSMETISNLKFQGTRWMLSSNSLFGIIINLKL